MLYGPGYGFSIISMLFPVFFGLVFAFIGFTLVRNIMQWNKNNHSPRLQVPAIVTGKRANTTHHHDAANNGMTHTTTTYYVTFEVESGDRMEFIVNGSEYGMMAEGDQGMLYFQGTRFLDFVRDRD